eukprot:6725099-Pyramimonas_sp.AAC.1
MTGISFVECGQGCFRDGKHQRCGIQYVFRLETTTAANTSWASCAEGACECTADRDDRRGGAHVIDPIVVASTLAVRRRRARLVEEATDHPLRYRVA